MKFTLKIALVLMVVFALSTLAIAQKADAAKGATLFGTKCASCHGVKGEGKPAIEKMFSVKMLPLNSKDVQAKTDKDLEKDILEGKGKMKPVKVTNSEAADVIAFLRTLK
jgi:mono/diheme cytochrome c family protein